jgi:hypothetical protein
MDAERHGCAVVGCGEGNFVQYNVSPATLGKIDRVISRSNFRDLTPETVLAAFEAEGIRSLEDVAERLTVALRSDDGQPQPIPYETLFAEPTPREIVAAIEHPVPEVPFVVDGVWHDPGDIVRYNGQELSYFPQKGGTELLILTDKRLWAPLVQTSFLMRTVANGLAVHGHPLGTSIAGPGFGGSSDAQGVVGPPDARTLNLFQTDSMGPVPDPPPPWTAGLEHINMNGDGLWLYSAESRRDLTEVSLGLFDDWNDKFSSMHRTTSLCGAFSDVGFRGDYWQFGPSFTNWLDLRQIGWNDRISSFINSG